MRRHPSLIPLSRFHRSVLFLAFVLKKNGPEVKGYPTDIEGKKLYAIDFIENKLLAHFDIEEKQLLPMLQSIEALKPLCEKVVEDHRQIRELANELSTSNDLIKCLDEMGHLLENHVRFEERQLFQQAQDLLGEEGMRKIKLV